MKLRGKTLAVMTALCLGALSSPAHAFDLEDYATTYRATRDAALKAANELGLSLNPFQMALSAVIQVAKRDHQILPDTHLFYPYNQKQLSGSCDNTTLGAPGDLAQGIEWLIQAAGALGVDSLGSVLREVNDDGVMGSSDLPFMQEFRQWREAEFKTWAQAGAAQSSNVPYNDSDFMTTLRATRDAMLKAFNEWTLAVGPYKAARDAYVAGTATYTRYIAAVGIPYWGTLTTNPLFE